jgi:nucleoid DNA-binding protein
MKKHVNLIKEMSDFIGSRSELTKTESKKLITEFFENFKETMKDEGITCNFGNLFSVKTIKKAATKKYDVWSSKVKDIPARKALKFSVFKNVKDLLKK